MTSIIIPFYSNVNLLEYCCRSLRAHLGRHDYELIIINDNPRIRLGRHIAKEAMILQRDQNGGYSVACNMAARKASGTHILFVDSDIVIRDDVLTPLYEKLRSGTEYAAVGSKIVKLASGEIEYYGLAFNEIDIIKPWQGNAADLPPCMKDRDFQVVPSGLFLIEKDVYDAVGGFDEELLNCYGDLDICLKIQQHGRKVALCARSVGYHRGASSGHVRHEWHADGKALFFRKWGRSMNNDADGFYKESVAYHASFMNFPPKCLAINFSRSIFGGDCLRRLARHAGIDLQSIEHYRDRNHTGTAIQLEDYLTWSTMRYGVPILYFVDRFKSLAENKYWFANRDGSGDIIMDIHGNIATPDQLL